jgi:hypothetical protein
MNCPIFGLVGTRDFSIPKIDPYLTQAAANFHTLSFSFPGCLLATCCGFHTTFRVPAASAFTFQSQRKEACACLSLQKCVAFPELPQTLPVQG